MQTSFKDQYKIKKHKDLQFLAQRQPLNIQKNIYKYLLKEGKGEIIINIHIPLIIYYNYEKYDYTGKILEKVNKKSINYLKDVNLQSENNQVLDAIYSMKMNEKSWFNLQLSNQNLQFEGYHYQIFVESFTYKHDNTLISKKIIYQQNRQKAKQLFKNNKFKDALRIYKNSINILSGLSKKNFKLQELNELNQLLEISESNYLKCVAKINGFGGRYNDEIGKTSKQLSEKFMKNFPQSHVSYYQKAIFLKYYSMFDAASQAIKQGLKKPLNQNPGQAALQKKTLLNMLQSIRKAKQRNIRHLKREQIRKKKTERKVNEIWANDSLISV